MIVEPFANDRLEDNLNPISRDFLCWFYSCVHTSSLAHNGPALGGQAGEGKLTESHKIGGLQSHKTCSKNPYNLVIEAKP